MRVPALVFSVLAVLSVACRREPSSEPHAVAAPSVAPRTVEPTLAVPTFRPGEGIGPVRIGMTLSELHALGLSPTPASWSPAAYDAGPYRVVLQNGLVDAIELELATTPDGVAVGGAVVAPSERSIEAIAAHLEGCGPLEIREGGNVIRCAGGTAWVKAAGPPGVVVLQVLARPEGQS